VADLEELAQALRGDAVWSTLPPGTRD
jgi:hypothetical protein